MITKVCLVCGNQFTIPKYRENIAKYCSKKCALSITRKNVYKYWEGKKGIKKSNSGSFQKGNKPWNTGTHIQINNALEKWHENGGEVWNKNKIGVYSEETIRKIKYQRSLQINIPYGETHWNWKGGKTPLLHQIRVSREYKLWRASIFERDKFTCVLCGKMGGELQVDHIVPFQKIIVENNIKTLEEAKKCKFLWDLKNGRCLCPDCHKQEDSILKAKVYLGKKRSAKKF